MLSKTPVECPTQLLSQAKRYSPMTVAIANAVTPLSLEGVRLACEHGLMVPVLIGDTSVIRQAASAIDWDIGKFRIESADNEHSASEIAVALAGCGEAHAIMKGDVHTDVLLRAVIDRKVGLRTGRLLSHIFHMTIPGSNKVLFITDAVLNVLPTIEQKAQIIRNAGSLLIALGYTEPKVAVLSASESVSDAMPSTKDAAQLAHQATAGAFPGLLVDGPLAFDLAVSREAASIKGVNSAIAGCADVLLVPNIETGNALFKLMVYFLSAAAAGIVLGAKVPIMLTSRADPVAARLASAALATTYIHNRSHDDITSADDSSD